MRRDDAQSHAYDAIPDVGALYDAVPAYDARADVGFYVAEAARARSVLELGCGTGRVLLPVARSGRPIVGVDGSRGMLDHCAAKLRAEAPAVRDRVRLHLSDVRDVALDERFELVTAPFRVLQHLPLVPDQLRFLEVVARHLEPGGRFVFDVFNPDFRRLAAHDGAEHEDTPELPLGDGRSFHRAFRIARVRMVDQVNETELIYYVRDEATKRVDRHVEAFDMRWYLRAELEHLLARACFEITDMYGDFSRAPLTDASPEMVVVARLAR